MGSIQKTVYYCSVSKGTRILYAYNGGDPEIENLAALCLERTPPYHRWYFQTMAKKTFGFFMEEGCVYFAIVDEGIGNRGVLRFLGHVRDEFKKAAKKGSSRSMSNLNSLYLHEQLVPVIRRLITSLENVSGTGSGWPAGTPSPLHEGLSPSPCNNANGQIEGAASTKAPLLGKPSRQDKKKMKDHVIGVRDIELEEHRRSTDRGIKVESGALDSNNQDTVVSPVISKEFSSMRMRASPQSIRKKWCRQVRIVLAIDLLVCLLLFGIWLGICRGMSCTR